MNWTLFAVLTSIIVISAGVAWMTWYFVGRQRAGRVDAQRIEVEDALKHLYNREAVGRPSTMQGLAGRLHITENAAAELATRMQARGLLTFVDGEPRLTQPGKDYALHVVRAHRLWERYLADKTGFEETSWHARAEIAEHSLSPDEASTLSGRLGNPLTDPHGDPIPTAEGEFAGGRGILLTQLESGESGRIVHLEDEPDAVFAQLVELGLFPGMVLQVVSQAAGNVRVRMDGRESDLSDMAAAAITVEPVAVHTPSEPAWTLADLEPPAPARIVAISPRCRGAERNRFLDLGIVPGTLITAELRSPSGDPTAFRVRDTLIALRKEQASMIQIRPLSTGKGHAAHPDSPAAAKAIEASSEPVKELVTHDSLN